MSRRTARVLLGGLAVPSALLVDLVLQATPAAAHNVSAGSLPAPSWLLGYIGAFAVAGTAIALRSSWPSPRLQLGAEADVDVDAEGLSTGDDGRSPLRLAGHAVGLALLGAVLYAAIVGPDANAANIAPVSVFVIWWVGLPILCLAVGDVMRAINPFVPLVAAGERVAPLARITRVRRPAVAPAWTAAAFLAAFSWFFLAYHSPGSPRALAVLLVVYTAAAVVGGLRWGQAWLGTGEGFAGISHAVAHLVRRRDAPHPRGLLALVVVWVGATSFDAVSSTSFWIDLEGTTSGWGRTLVNTAGLVWLIGIAAAIVLLAVRLLDDPTSGRLLGMALVPVALVWFLAHDVTFLLFEGQNFYALLSDPLGRGWDLFGTIDHTINYRVVTAGWVRWLQLVALLLGHVTAVVLAHDGALRLLGRKRGMRVTWAVTGVAAVSVVSAALLVLR
jgi:hypothetical protein